MKNILVTGAGAVLGQGIIRSLIVNRLDNIIIHSADPEVKSTGHFLADKAHVIPYAKDPEYISSIIDIINKFSIDLILIGTDTELPIFAKNKKLIEDSSNVKILVSNINVINIANDKFLTSKFLKDTNHPFPISYMAGDKAGVNILRSSTNFPFFAKPIDGARSRGLIKIKNDIDLKLVLDNPENLVIQEYLTDEFGEYTSGCLVFNGKCKAVVTLKRDLRDGNTYRAYYSNEYKKYDDFIISVAEKLGVEGPCNFQFRIKDNKPVIFEINARFSGTTPIRFMFGFNEVNACLNYILNNQDIKMPILKEGVVMRAWSDLFIENDQFKQLSTFNVLDNPKSIFHTFEK